MRHFLLSVRHCFQGWMIRMSACSDVTKELCDGLHAYAYRQCAIIALHATRAHTLWSLPGTTLLWIPPVIVELIENFNRSIADPIAAGTVEIVDDLGDEGLGMDKTVHEEYISDAK